MKVFMKKYLNISVSIIFVLFIVFVFSCTNQTQKVKLVESDFKISLPDSLKGEYLSTTANITIDKDGFIYVLDTGKNEVLQFSPSGEFKKVFVKQGRGFGYVYRPCSINVFDSLFVLHNTGSLEYFDLSGKYKDKVLSHGRLDVVYANEKIVVVSRMMDAYQYEGCIEKYNRETEDLLTFRSSRYFLHRDVTADFIFTRMITDSQLVVVPAVVDSIFLYDLNGKLKKSKRIKNVRGKYKDIPDSLIFKTEDIYVENENIYLLRVDHKKSTDEMIYVKHIDQYNLDLELVQTYELPYSVTMTVALEPWSFCYHKFFVRGNKFYFMISEPQEHLVMFESFKR